MFPKEFKYYAAQNESIKSKLIKVFLMYKLCLLTIFIQTFGSF